MCSHCNDTGRLSKEPWGYYDCGYCGAAQERTALEAWADSACIDCENKESLWVIYQHGKTAQAGQHQ